MQWWRPASVMAAAVAMAERIAANGPLGLAASKELVRLSVVDPTAARDRQAEWSSVVFSSEDAMEGARAYMEKARTGVEGSLTCGPPSATPTGAGRW